MEQQQQGKKKGMKRQRSSSADSRKSTKSADAGSLSGVSSKKKKAAAAFVMDKSTEKYLRGDLKFNTSHIKHKGLKKTMAETQERIIDAASRTAATEVLLPSEAGFIETDIGERTFKLKQKEIVGYVDLNTGRNAIDLQLTTFGPYTVNYSRNGRYMLFAGHMGHVATYDCLRTAVGMEMQLQETVYDVHYLHNETLFAAAQAKYTYIYDHKGVEIHCMKKHERPYRLDFLPYHFLLTTVGHSGWIKWHDVSIGEYVAGYQTGHGPCKVLRHNPTNAVSHVGHSNGVVSLWSPASGKALVSMFCHKSPVTDVAVDREGRYMTTAGLDGFMKVWDLRKYTCLHSYKCDHPVVSLDISDKGLIAMGNGRSVHVLKDAFTQPADITYLKHTVRTPNASLSHGGGVTASVRALASSVSVNTVRFRPLEDVLCVSHSHGLSTIIVPGAGEPNFDTFESNPFSNSKQRKESEVQGLLNKLSHEMIGLDASFVGKVDKDQQLLQREQNEVFNTANTEIKKKDKMKARGRNKISAKLRRKQKNVVDSQTIKLKEKLAQEKEKAAQEKIGGAKEEKKKTALSRFEKK